MLTILSEGHPHVILSKILTSAYKHMRLFATNYLRVLFRSNVKGFNEWGIRLLITQLYDPSIEVCEMAVLVLDEACINEANLATLVEMKPNISHLDFATDTLLLR
jgi:large subunit ribosomal protein L17e